MKIHVVFLLMLSCVYAYFEKECLQKVENAENIGAVCTKQLKILCKRHDILFTLWDASSKIIRSGMQAASPMDLGNYDLCTKVDTRIEETDILGKFCPFEWATMLPKKSLEEFVAALEILPNTSTELSHLEQENQNVNENGLESIASTGALCITDGCSPKEFSTVFNSYLYPVSQNNMYDCVTKNTRRDLSTFQLIATIFLGMVGVTVIFCTIVHVVYHYRELGKLNEYVEGFSAFHNGRKLITISNDKVNQIQCMNGMRFISMLWIVAGHGFLTAEGTPVVNQEDGLNWKTSLYSQYIQAAVFAVDTFFFLSGFLLTYGYLSKMKNCSVVQQITGIPLIYLNRYLRLTPAVGAMFLTAISFFKLLGDGPIWFITYDILKVPCTKYWWRFFLYIQNYFPNDLCFTQTWYLSADMQMFIFAPLVLIPCSRYFEKKTNIVVASLITLIGIFVGLTIAIPYTIDGYENNYDTHSRVSGYLVGIIGGVIFSKIKGKQVKIKRVTNISLWVATLGIMTFLAYCNYYATQYNPTKLNTTLYTAFYRPIWCTCILWIVFSCYHGYGGFVNWFLSNPLFQVGARLSYCMYVLHGMIVFYSVGKTRTSIYFQDYEMISMVWGYINNCILISVVWTLIFEGPMIMLNKKLFTGIGAGNDKSQSKKEIP